MGSAVASARPRVLPLPFASALAVPVAVSPAPAMTVPAVAMLREAMAVLLGMRLAVSLTLPGKALSSRSLGPGCRGAVGMDARRRLPGLRTMAGIGLLAM